MAPPTPRLTLEERKIEEGHAAIKDAKKCLKTSVFGRWKPDWESAAAGFERAATCFKVGKAPREAIAAYKEASEALTHMESGFMAAKHLESAAFVARDLKEYADAAALYEQAAELHRLDGRVDNGAEALVKGAKALEEQDNAGGASLMLQACALYDDEEEEPRLLASIETFKQAVSYLCRIGQLPTAADLLIKQGVVHARLAQPHAVARSELSRVVLLLASDNYAQACESHEEAQERETNDACFFRDW